MHDILGNNSILVNSNFVTTAKKDIFSESDRELQSNCKILKFTEEWNFDEVLLQIFKLDPVIYPNLFIFIIETTRLYCLASIDSLKTFLINFDKDRSIVLQLTLKNENNAKFYYKENGLLNFKEAEDQQTINSGDFNNFPSFLWHYLNNTVNLNNFENKKLNDVQNSSIILKFVKILEVSEELIDELILKCAAEGSTSDLIAITDGYTDDKGKVCGHELKYYLRIEFNSTSVLKTAIQHSNYSIIDFLTENYANLIQQLPFEHQIAISTLTFSTKQVDVLCDLLENADFPFPDNKDLESADNFNLQEVIAERKQFHEFIISENILEIKKFKEKYPNLKYAYNLDNKSALGKALDSKKYEAFYFLKSFRFCDQQIENFNQKDKKKAKNIVTRQRIENVNLSESNKLNSALRLATRSLIYHRNKTNEAEYEQHKKIREWLKDISKTKFGSQLFDAAVQCEDLKIIFDFECKSTKNSDPSSTSQSHGSTYPVSKWIFIGAKMTGKKEREQEIKGVIAHEICHYVIGLVYQNNEKPYYENDKYAREKFDEVVAETKTILDDAKINIQPDRSNDEEMIQEEYDECNGIISSVYDLYEKADWHPELIVRPVQIQVQFHNCKKIFRHLDDKYEMLFSFFQLFVISELKKFNLKNRKYIQKFNNCANLLNEIRELKLKFLKLNNVIYNLIRELSENQMSIVVTNVPKLLLVNIFNYFCEKDKKMFDIRNIFMNSSLLENVYALEKFKKIINQCQQLNVIVDCSKQNGKIINFVESNRKFIFIVSNENQQEVLNKELTNKKLNAVKLTVNYKWTDLTTESKKSLLQTKVNFQNNSKVSLMDLLQNRDQKIDCEASLANIVDIKLLNLILEKNGIVINQNFEDDIIDKYLRIMFQSRNFVKISDNEKLEIIKQDQILSNSENLKFVLISDKAGSGKSWILKTFTTKLRKMCPKMWITYVDLKQFIANFRTQNNEIEFSSFMTENILKLKNNFELEIFKQLYKSGKICILFDGFDEIAPDCAELVTKLFQSFQQNGGNQLWIATRDCFEVDLKEKLGLDVVYKLDEFTAENGIKLISSSWLLNELQAKGESYNEIFEEKYSKKLKNFKIMARKLNEKIPKSQNDSIGLPQFYKMIADISSKNKDFAMNFTTLKYLRSALTSNTKDGQKIKEN